MGERDAGAHRGRRAGNAREYARTRTARQASPCPRPAAGQPAATSAGGPIPEKAVRRHPDPLRPAKS